MKTTILFCAGAALFASSLVSVHGQDKEKISVGEVLMQISKKDPNIIVGHDFVSENRDKIADRAAVLAAIDQLNFPKLRKMVEDETDYEFWTGKDYALMIPKNDPARHDIPVTKRMVTYPQAVNMRLDKFLRQIKSQDEAHPIYFGDALEDTAHVSPSTPLFMNGGQGACYQLLNTLARNLKTRCWIIERGPWDKYDIKTGKLFMPAPMGICSIGFYSEAGSISNSSP